MNHRRLQLAKAKRATAAASAEAREITTDLLEAEARKRAMGEDEDQFYKGKKIGSIKRYSDSLLMFLMQAADPKKFGKPEVSADDLESLEKILSQLAA